jgi:hypothetical protein
LTAHGLEGREVKINAGDPENSRIAEDHWEENISLC